MIERVRCECSLFDRPKNITNSNFPNWHLCGGKLIQSNFRMQVSPKVGYFI